MRRGSFRSNETKTLFVTDATVGDHTFEIERLVPRNGSQPMVLGHNGHGNSVAENGKAAAALEGDVLQVSVLMADLRGFTMFCERVPPGRMSRVLNEYLTAMVDVILGHQRRVQDFVGDGILGVFGAPGQDPDHAWHAALSALEMQVAIRRLGGQWERDGVPTRDDGTELQARALEDRAYRRRFSWTSSEGTAFAPPTSTMLAKRVHGHRYHLETHPSSVPTSRGRLAASLPGSRLSELLSLKSY